MALADIAKLMCAEMLRRSRVQSNKNTSSTQNIETVPSRFGRLARGLRHHPGKNKTKDALVMLRKVPQVRRPARHLVLVAFRRIAPQGFETG